MPFIRRVRGDSDAGLDSRVLSVAIPPPKGAFRSALVLSGWVGGQRGVVYAGYARRSIPEDCAGIALVKDAVVALFHLSKGNRPSPNPSVHRSELHSNLLSAISPLVTKKWAPHPPCKATLELSATKLMSSRPVPTSSQRPGVGFHS